MPPSCYPQRGHHWLGLILWKDCLVEMWKEHEEWVRLFFLGLFMRKLCQNHWVLLGIQILFFENCLIGSFIHKIIKVWWRQICVEYIIITCSRGETLSLISCVESMQQVLALGFKFFRPCRKLHTKTFWWHSIYCQLLLWSAISVYLSIIFL